MGGWVGTGRYDVRRYIDMWVDRKRRTTVQACPGSVKPFIPKVC